MSVLSPQPGNGADELLLSSNAFPMAQSCSVTFDDPFELYGRVTGYGSHSFYLDHDYQQDGYRGRFSYVGCDPYMVIKGKGSSTHIYKEGNWKEHKGDAFMFLQQQLVGAPSKNPPFFLPFSGGVIGCFSYDLVRNFEVLPEITTDDLQFPDLYALFVEVFVAIDHRQSIVWLVFSPSPERMARENSEKLYREGQLRLEELRAKVYSKDRAWKDQGPGTRTFHLNEGQSASDYQDRIRECQRYIEAGDIYQANLSHRFLVEGIVDGFQSPVRAGAYLYRDIQKVNPSPHSAFFVFDADVIVCNSPERLVRLSGGHADMRPIAGTRPRGKGTAEDRRRAEDLLSSSKERAEHLMLVDLVRNDLGRVCRYGSIHVDEFMTVERYSHVMHLVSHVVGRLREECHAFDLIRAVFPGGTITGVPKVRCMQIIEHLEPVRRGLYTGSLGFLGWNGNLDLNIVIRTLLLSNNCGYLQVGAGIVADSDPKREYQETLHKAEAFFQVLQSL